jgi:ferredoxin-thioredoxin reductase catalytic subunit
MTTIKELRKVFGEFCKKNDFQLNPDKEHLDMTLEGVMINEKNTGLRFCPCRIQTGDLKKDQWILCPCNFKQQETWQKEGRCWCGLFVKK